VGLRRDLALAILGQGLSDWVSLLTISGYARRLAGDDRVDHMSLAIDVVRELQRDGFVRVGRPEEGVFREVEGNLDTHLAEAMSLYGELGDAGTEWQWYLWTDNTPTGDDLARSESMPIMRLLHPEWRQRDT